MGKVGYGMASVAGTVYVLDMGVSEELRSNRGIGERVYDQGRTLGFPQVYRAAPNAVGGTC
jgi:hypothetical protein